MSNNKIVGDPTLADLVQLVIKQVNLDLNCCHLATIQEFNGETKTCKATINYKKTVMQRQENGQYSPVLIDYPILADVPVVTLRGGTAFLSMPIQPGDQALILFNDRDIDNWYAGKSNGSLATNRLHSFSDGIALVGLINLSQTDSTFDSLRAVLANGDALVGVSTSKILIKNQLHTLNDLLQELVTDVKALVTATAAITVTGVQTGGGTSGTPANAAAINAAGTQLTTTAAKIAALLE